MNTVLKRFLDALDSIGDQNEELFDSDVRQRMSNAIMEGFVRNRKDYEIPNDFGMFSEQANAAVRNAILNFVVMATHRADALGLSGFHERLLFVQDAAARSDAGNDYDDFLGHSPPGFFDEMGNVIQRRKSHFAEAKSSEKRALNAGRGLRFGFWPPHQNLWANFGSLRLPSV